MEHTTFRFTTRKSFERVFNALNDSFYTFYTKTDNTIVLYGYPAINQLKAALDGAHIEYTTK